MNNCYLWKAISLDHHLKIATWYTEFTKVKIAFMEVNAEGDGSIAEIPIEREQWNKGKIGKPCPDCRSPSMRYL